MTARIFSRKRRAVFSIFLTIGIALLITSAGLRADQVEMQNGDRYVGTVVSMTGETLVLKSDVLGTVTLPRAKVAHLSFGTTTTNATRAVVTTTNLILKGTPATNVNTLPVPGLPKIKVSSSGTNVMQDVQQQLLGDASPEARAKFNELATGYLSGSVSVDDIRAQAKAALEQLKALKTGAGDEADSSLEGYAAILEGFLNETATPAPTNTPATKPNLK